MRVYISYSHKNAEFVDRLVSELENANFEIWIDRRLKPGDSWTSFMEEGLRTSQALIVVLSQASVVSEWVNSEFATFALTEDSKQKRIIPVLIENCEIPTFLANRTYADFRSSFEMGFETLRRGLDVVTKGQQLPSRTPEEEEAPRWPEILHNAFRSRNLCLFVGAGVSADAGLAQWSQLLNNLLRDMFRSRGPGSDVTPEQLDRLAKLFQERLGLSPLITARYLKDTLREKFHERVRQALYEKDPVESKQIQAIVELCRPRRNGAVLHSIVTFNFDDVLERNLREQHVSFSTIHKEGQRCEPECLPIYHVHGFLPNVGVDIEDAPDIIFSEDAYHSQFIEPFSWSNLTQLTALTQNTCLLVGISLTDPNLRRLLDVAMRKNPRGARHHYVIRRRHDEKSLLKGVENPGEEERDLLRTLRRRAHVLEEQDVNSLGLNMIWVDGFEEIPGILHRIAAEPS